MLKISQDKLDRVKFIDKLFTMFDNFGNQGERGFTIVINGKYGSGKSTLLGFIEEKSEKDQKYGIVKYNAWESNLFDNPLIPILYEVGKLQKKSGKIKSGALKVVKSLPKIITGTLSNVHGVDLKALIDDTNIFVEYDNYRKALEEFRSILTGFCKDKIVLFLVDELDRCLPDYQIKVLEALYHLFEIPNLIVVIALDKQQLESSIKDKFGESLNTLGYLAKFINYHIDLPDENDNGFIKSLMRFECSGYVDETSMVKDFIVKLFYMMGYSIRECQRVVNEMNLICNKDDGDGEKTKWKYWYPILIALILIVKHSEDAIYRKWFYADREDYFGTGKSMYVDSAICKFFNDVNATKVGKIFDYIKNPSYRDGVAESFRVHFINAFCPIDSISENELKEHLGITGDDRRQLYDGMRYPYSINQAIRQVKLLSL